MRFVCRKKDKLLLLFCWFQIITLEAMSKILKTTTEEFSIRTINIRIRLPLNIYLFYERDKEWSSDILTNSLKQNERDFDIPFCENFSYD